MLQKALPALLNLDLGLLSRTEGRTTYRHDYKGELLHQLVAHSQCWLFRVELWYGSSSCVGRTIQRYQMHFFFQDHLSPLQLHNLGAHLVIPHCLKVIGSEMFASEIGWDLNQAVINIY